MEAQIRTICIRLLTRREHSRRQLQEKLAQRGYPSSQTLPIIDELAAKDWQSDLRFGQSYARHRIKQGIGPVKITAELYQRGVVGIDLQPILADIADDWQEVMVQTYRKKYQTPAQNKRQQASRMRFLQQRGFADEMIINYLSKN